MFNIFCPLKWVSDSEMRTQCALHTFMWAWAQSAWAEAKQSEQMQRINTAQI